MEMCALNMSNMFHILVKMSFFISVVYCKASIIKQTDNGPVTGTLQTSVFGKEYYSFRGISYAEAPITGIDPHTGANVDRRFKPPVPLQRKWTVPTPDKYGKVCIPSNYMGPSSKISSEDCLFLNVFVPAGGALKKTVMVWIHGGGFDEGDATDFMYRPDFLIDPDNIIITLAYRLGIYGFLNLGPDSDITGNMGLKDQQVALEWIHKNCIHFGGNPDEILLFGESAGAASVHFHMHNKRSRNFFKRVALFSSTVYNRYALEEKNHLNKMLQVTEKPNLQELRNYLRTQDENTIAKLALEKFPMKSTEMIMIWPFVPTIESPKAEHAFITKSPEEIYKSGEEIEMDALFGFTSQEYITFNHNLTTNTEPLLNGDWSESKLELPFDGFDKDTYPEDYKTAFDSLKQAYCSDTSSVDAIKDGNIRLLSDLNFGYGILKGFQQQVEANNKNPHKLRKTYLQRFSVSADLNAMRILNKLDFKGATHAEDLFYLYWAEMLEQNIYGNIDWNDKTNINYITIMRLVHGLTNFARTGNPSIKGDTPFQSSTPRKTVCHDITNKPLIELVMDIMEQMHYKKWNNIEISHKKHNQGHATGHGKHTSKI